MRFVFFLPNLKSPVGGVNVTIEIAQTLRSAGYEAIALYPQAGYRYPFVQHDLPGFHRTDLTAPLSLKRQLRQMISSAKSGRIPDADGKTEPFVARADDVIMVPEFTAAWLSAKFPSSRKVLMLQNGFSALKEAAAPGFAPADYVMEIAFSEACAEASRLVCGRAPEQISLAIDPHKFAYTERKKLQLAYMPRRRFRDLEILEPLLKKAPALRDVEFVSIHQLTADEAAAKIREALFFMSFAEREGFGLPAAEAMATGAIVMGFTGVGGNEFFTPDVSFPVPEEDVSAFYETVTRVVTEYKTSPSRLDAMRRAASTSILSRYTVEAFQESTLRVFAKLSAPA